jgi:outer membrane protein OmpU
MNNLKKIGLSALAGSLVAFSANAGEMTVSGGANLYMSAGDETAKTTWSNDDHVTFSGSGELDNGMTVTYSLQLDGDEADDGVVDNHSITIDTNGSGTVTYSGHGGDTVMGGMDDKTPNAYEEAWDSLTQTGTDSVINGVGGNDIIRYDSPSFSGAQVHASVRMNSAVGVGGVYNDFGVTFSPEMVEGLTLGYAFGETEETAGTAIDDSTFYVTYAFGPVTIGYQESESDAATATNSDESETFGISYQITDEFSVSYNTHDYNDGAWTSDEEYSGISASYTMGGITIAGHMNEVENRGGSSTAADVEGYELNLGFAF